MGAVSEWQLWKGDMEQHQECVEKRIDWDIQCTLCQVYIGGWLDVGLYIDYPVDFDDYIEYQCGTDEEKEYKPSPETKEIIICEHCIKSMSEEIKVYKEEKKTETVK